MKRMTRVLLVAGVALALAGCGGDVAQQLMSNPEMQGKVMDMISTNMPMAQQMMDKFLGNEETRTMVLDKLMANADAKQSMMAGMAKNQTMVDGIINLAVQDSSMKGHIMSMFQGMKMVAGK